MKGNIIVQDSGVYVIAQGAPTIDITDSYKKNIAEALAGLQAVHDQEKAESADRQAIEKAKILDAMVEKYDEIVGYRGPSA
jgi:hypothetical protein